jgi:hypothetical protein
LPRCSEKPSALELRRRIQEILRKLNEPVRSTDTLRGLRSVEVLEHIGTPEAREVLQVLAGRTPTH